MLLKISLILFTIFFLNSCSINKYNNNIIESLNEKKEIIIKTKEVENTKQDNINKKNQIIKKSISVEKKFPIYIIGEPYFIEGVNYIPKEDYTYNQMGLATFYGKELHNIKTVNNEYNKVTELYARHKTLPIPSVVKITNLENGLSIVVRVNDRSNNNSTIIEVSRKVAQLLRFFKHKYAKVRIEILSDASKQLKIVTMSTSDPEFNITIESAPTEDVTITDLGEITDSNIDLISEYKPPIELGTEDVIESKLFIKIEGFDSYSDTQKVIKILDKNYKTTIQSENNEYILFFGPMLNEETYKLFQFLVSKGYKNSKIIIE